MKTDITSPFHAIILSYGTVPALFRDTLSLDESSSRSLLRHLSSQLGLTNLLIYSTTSSLGVYYYSPSEHTCFITHFITQALFKQNQGMGIVGNNELSYEKVETVVLHSDPAVQYLYRVSAGLEASAPGDIQGYREVKQAYERSVQEGVAGRLLRKLMQTILLLKGIGWN